HSQREAGAQGQERGRRAGEGADGRLLDFERHGREVDGGDAAPGRRHVRGGRGDLGVGGPVEPVDDLAARALVEEPRASAWTAEVVDAGEVDAAHGEGFERPRGIVGAAQAHDAGPQPRDGGPEREVEDGAAGLGHPRPAVGEDDVVHEEVAEDDEVRRAHRAGRARKARTSAASRPGSSGFVQSPSCFSQEPTMKASASAKAAMFSAVIPDPTSTGIPTAARTARTSAGSAGRPVAVPVTITPSARKNSAACAVSPMETSAVTAWAACFFFTSTNTLTSSAPIARR